LNAVENANARQIEFLTELGVLKFLHQLTKQKEEKKDLMGWI